MPGQFESILDKLQRKLGKQTIRKASSIARPKPRPEVVEMNLFNEFAKRNPKAGGGLLNGSSEEAAAAAFRKKVDELMDDGYDFGEAVREAMRQGYQDGGKVKPPTKKQLEITEKVYSKKYGKTGIDLWESLKQFERSNIRQKQTTGGYGGVPGGKLKKNMLSKDDFIKLVNQNKDKTYNEFVELIKTYKTKEGRKFTKDIVADRLRSYNLSGSFKKKPAKGRSEKSIEKRRKAQRKRYFKMKKTEEGRDKIKQYRKATKAREYQKLGMDPPAFTAEEAIWKDAVSTAKKNIDGKGRFVLKSGYEKSMSPKNFYSNKIEIVDKITGKKFNYNTYKNFIVKNAKSFNIKSYDDAIKPYRQKAFINNTPGLRNNVNTALIPNYNTGMSANAFTIQHDVGRQSNPLKTSLAFYDDNTKEFRIRDTFEKSWEKSKTSKTPLADRKKAFNIFKTDIGKLNIRSQPSMVKRGGRTFGKELDLAEGLRIAKQKGAKIPKGVFKQIAQGTGKEIKSADTYYKEMLENYEKNFDNLSPRDKMPMYQNATKKRMKSMAKLYAKYGKDVVDDAMQKNSINLDDLTKPGSTSDRRDKLERRIRRGPPSLKSDAFGIGTAIEEGPRALKKAGQLGVRGASKILGYGAIPLELYFMNEARKQGKSTAEILAMPLMLEGRVGELQDMMKLTPVERQGYNRAKINEDVSLLDTDFYTPDKEGIELIDNEATKDYIKKSRKLEEALRRDDRSKPKQRFTLPNLTGILEDEV